MNTPPLPSIDDLSSPQILRNPYPTYDLLRRYRPVYYDAGQNICVVTRYADVVDVMLDTGVFSSCVASFERTLLGADGAAHTRARRVVGRGFSVKAVSDLEPLIRSVTGDLLERVAARGACEFINDFARPLPLLIVATMLGVDRARLIDLQRWSMAIIRSSDPSTPRNELLLYETEAKECRRFLINHLTQLRFGSRDLRIARFLTGMDDGLRLTVDEQLNVTLLLIVAGAETAAKLIGNAMLLLLQDVALQSYLRERPHVLSSFVEEVLRYESPTQRVWRMASHSSVIRGVEIKPGTRMMLLLGSANRDPEKFHDADQFRPERSSNDHIAFGVGRHLCVAARLARLEAVTALTMFLERFQQFSEVVPDTPVVFDSHPALRGPVTLNLSVLAGPKR